MLRKRLTTMGSYKYGKEKIYWLYKPVKKVLDLWLKSKSGADGFQTFDHLVMMINHAMIIMTLVSDKGHSRIMHNFITCTRSPEDGWR
jgi:hypothetical protein